MHVWGSGGATLAMLGAEPHLARAVTCTSRPCYSSRYPLCEGKTKICAFAGLFEATGRTRAADGVVVQVRCGQQATIQHSFAPTRAAIATSARKEPMQKAIS